MAGSCIFQITWARLQDSYRPYSVLTIGDQNYVEDKRYVVSKPHVLNTDTVSLIKDYMRSRIVVKSFRGNLIYLIFYLLGYASRS